MAGLDTLVLEGEPYERGAKHGEAFADEVRNNAEFYYRYFADNGVDEATARSHAERYVSDIEGTYPEYVEELRGVADGSGVPLEEVTMISLRHTILYSAYAATDSPESGSGVRAREPTPEAEGCTSFGLEPSATANGHTYVGQNWDWKPPVEQFVMDVRREERPNAVVLTEAGNVFGKFGVNERGIGFAANGLSTPADGDHPFRKPSHIRGREIMEAERFEQALGAVITEDRPTSRNYLLGHADGEIVDLETTPDSCYYLYPEDGIVTHANHFENRAAVDSRFEEQSPDTVYRANRLRKGLSGEGQVDEETVKGALRDHFGRPKSVCRHYTERSDEFESHTNASLIMDLTDRRLLATDGPPCENEYHEYRVHGS